MDQGACASSGKGSEAEKMWALMGLSSKGEPISENAKQARGEVQHEHRERRVRMGAQEKMLRAADRRRRLRPLRDALQRAREFNDEKSWESAMAEMAQVALEGEHPEREGAHLLLAGEVIVADLTQRAARALIEPIRRERVLTGVQAVWFGPLLSPRSELLAQVWIAAAGRARLSPKD